MGSRSFKDAIVKDLRKNEQALLLEGDELGDFNRTIWERSLRRGWRRELTESQNCLAKSLMILKRRIPTKGTPMLD